MMVLVATDSGIVAPVVYGPFADRDAALVFAGKLAEDAKMACVEEYGDEADVRVVLVGEALVVSIDDEVEASYTPRLVELPGVPTPALSAALEALSKAF